MTETRPAPIFIADALGLDFLNSLATPVHEPVEWLANGDDLIAWLEQAKLIPAQTADSFKLTSIPGELDTIAAQARALREWFRGFVRAHIGHQLTREAIDKLAPLNHILAREEEYGQIVAPEHVDPPPHGAAPSALAWQPLRRWRSPESLLLPIARAMADLVCHENFEHVRACEGPSCTLLFIDRSNGNKRRRWCSMAVCGNRAKAQAHRERLRQTKV